MLIFLVLLAQTMNSNAQTQATNIYDSCVLLAQQQTGYQGAPSPQQSQRAANAPLRGAAGGALSGALIGGMGGGNSGQGAAIGAGFGLVAGVARRNEAKRQMQSEENNFYNALNACLERAQSE